MVEFIESLVFFVCAMGKLHPYITILFKVSCRHNWPILRHHVNFSFVPSVFIL